MRLPFWTIFNYGNSNGRWTGTFLTGNTCYCYCSSDWKRWLSSRHLHVTCHWHNWKQTITNHTLHKNFLIKFPFKRNGLPYCKARLWENRRNRKSSIWIFWYLLKISFCSIFQHSIHRWWRHYVIINSILDRRITPYLGDLCFRKYSSRRIDKLWKLPYTCKKM